MSRFFRAASYAAASFVFLFGTVHAGPSKAWELTVAPPPLIVDASGPALDGGLSPAAAESAAPNAASAPMPAATAATMTLPPIAKAEEATPLRRNLADLVSDHAAASTDDAEHECLAGAVYFEAKGESLQGQLTVAEVILNRVRSGRFAGSVCGVVKQRGQFSFVRGGRIPPVARSSAAWRKAVAVARIAREDLADGAAPRALFFHARHVSPRWKLTRIASVGNHIFYR